MSFKLKSITPTSWLVLNDGEETRVGLLTEIRSQYVLMISGEKQKFLDKKSVIEFFNADIFNSIQKQASPTEKIGDNLIGGYPTDCDSPIEAFISGNTLPLYTKKASSEVIFGAGYYCLHFPRNIMVAHCPKLTTLETYKFDGPYRTMFEANSALTISRRARIKSLTT